MFALQDEELVCFLLGRNWVLKILLLWTSGFKRSKNFLSPQLLCAYKSWTWKSLGEVELILGNNYNRETSGSLEGFWRSCFLWRYFLTEFYWSFEEQQCLHLQHKQSKSLTFMEPCIARCVFYITNEMQLIQCYLLLLSALYMFRAFFPPIIRSL
jgi:hypothetical protein